MWEELWRGVVFWGPLVAQDRCQSRVSKVKQPTFVFLRFAKKWNGNVFIQDKHDGGIHPLASMLVRHVIIIDSLQKRTKK